MLSSILDLPLDPVCVFVISLVFSVLMSYYICCWSCRDFQPVLLIPAFLQQEHQCDRLNCWLLIVLSPMLTFLSCFFRSLEKKMGEGDGEKTIVSNSSCCSEPFSCAVNHLNCIYILVVQILNGANYICIDIVLPHCSPDMVQILLMLTFCFCLVFNVLKS